MGAAEIVSKISARQVEGMMLHDNLADYYSFLCLDGYSKMHEYHFFNETKSMRRLHDAFLSHNGSLVPVVSVNSDSYIPSSWYSYKSRDVGTETKKTAVKNAMNDWLSWEKETKSFYEKMYLEIFDEGDIALACAVEDLIMDVAEEVRLASSMCINLGAIDYNLNSVIEKQKEMCKHYSKRIETLM